MAKSKKPSSRTVDEKLRGLVNLKILDRSFFTQKELAGLLGISERTIRRFKNQSGYQLAPKTIARIKENVAKEDNKIKRAIDSGTAIRIKTVTVRGKRRRIPELVKDKTFKRPKSRILQFPVIYPAKNGASQTVSTIVAGWSASQIIDLITAAHSERRFTSWHARVLVPVGVSRSGRKGEGEIVGDEAEIDEETGEELTPKPEYYMVGPFSLIGNRPKIASEINYHMDAGRVIVSIYLVENLKGEK